LKGVYKVDLNTKYNWMKSFYKIIYFYKKFKMFVTKYIIWIENS